MKKDIITIYISQCLINESKRKKPYEKLGSDFFDELYHAGPKKIDRILKKKLQARDEGWFGSGFYVATDADYVLKWYGSVLTTIKPNPDARVLVASLNATKDMTLYNDIMKHEQGMLKAREAKSRGEYSSYIETLKKLYKKNQIEWVHAVDRFAEDNEFDIVFFLNEEIVIKNPKSVKITSSEKRENET